MEKYTKLKGIIIDNDGVIYNSLPLIQNYVELNYPQFSTSILNTREGNISALQFLYEFAIMEIEIAKKKNRKPKLPNLDVMRNDIVRSSSVQSYDYYYDNYIRPLNQLGEILKTAQNDKERFLEERDATLEADGKLDAMHGVIPYDKIYQEKNWMPFAKENIRELYNVFGDRLISLTAHNGIDDMHGRELEAKGAAIHSMVKDIKHYGLRFHPYEHIPGGAYRPINSKAERLMQIFNVDNLVGFVTPDDSEPNCKDFYEHGASPIWITQSCNNPNGFATAKSIKPESIYRELKKLGYDDDSDEILQKPKVLRK